MTRIYDIIDKRSKMHPDRIALQQAGKLSLSYSALAKHIDYIIETLNSVGITRNDTVAVIMPNGTEMATVCLGVMSCASCAPLNPEYRHDELVSMLTDLEAKALIISNNQSTSASIIADQLAIPVLATVIRDEDPTGIFTFQTASAHNMLPELLLAEGEDIALLLHTSGTTYRPKIVPLNHINILATATNLNHAIAIDEHDICLNMMPMFHIGGLVDLLISPLYSGGRVVLTSAFSAGTIPALITEFSPTWTQVVPTMLEDIYTHFSDHPESLTNGCRLKFIRSVAARLPMELTAKFEEIFEIPVIEVYGMTETTTLITTNPLPPAERIPGSVGLPSGPEVAVMDTDGNRLPSGCSGEIVVRGPSIMSGYRAVVDNDSTFFDDWFRTGDYGHFDEQGYLFLTGRIKEIINRGGEKIAPAEVDDIIKDWPAIADAACFGIAHRTLGEDIAAALVVNDESDFDLSDFMTYLSQKLSYFKVPGKLYLTDHIDRTQNGKVRRSLLPERFVDATAVEYDAADSADDSLTQLGEQLAEMWCAVLEIDGIKPTDNFFDLGGDSLKALTFLVRLNEIGGENVFVTALYDAPTLHQFEELLSQHHPGVCQRVLGQRVIQDSSITRNRLDDSTFTVFRDSIPKLSFPKSVTAKKNPRAIFVLCPPRSGSTLFRVMLAGNPKLFSPPELYLLNFDDMAERKSWFSGAQRGHLEGLTRSVMQLRCLDTDQAIRQISTLESDATGTLDMYNMIQRWLKNRTLVEKTPFYSAYPEVLERMETCFDEPLYIHLSRHPYGMIRSFTEARMDQFWHPRLHGEAFAKSNPSSYDSSEYGELVWHTVHRNNLIHLETVTKDRQIHVKFEDILAAPEKEMRIICQFADIEYDEGMLDPYAERSERMTDGLHEISQMVGDIKFEKHGQINRSKGDEWKSHYEIDFLNDLTWEIAMKLGHNETIASCQDREDFEI